MLAGLKLKTFSTAAVIFSVVHDAGAEGVDADGDRVRIADGVGELDFAALG